MFSDNKKTFIKVALFCLLTAVLMVPFQERKENRQEIMRESQQSTFILDFLRKEANEHPL